MKKRTDSRTHRVPGGASIRRWLYKPNGDVRGAEKGNGKHHPGGNGKNRQALKSRAMNEAVLHDIIESNADGILVVDRQGTLRFANAAAAALFGRAKDDLVDHPFGFPLGTPDKPIEIDLLHKDRVITAEMRTAIMPWAGQPAYIVSLRDITERKAQEKRIERLNLMLAVSSGVNRAIVRIGDRAKLLEEVCRIAVDSGRFLLAWIGQEDPERQKIVPLARAGDDGGCFVAANLSTGGNGHGNDTPPVLALQQDAPVICNDIAGESASRAWRDAALKRGWRSMAAYPLVAGRQPAGVLVLCAAETGFFLGEEQELLFEMAGNVAFALEAATTAEKLSYVSHYDTVTGLPNRVLFQERLEQHLASSPRDGQAFAVVLCDLERLRFINDTMGRRAGDQVLRQVAQWLESYLEEKHFIAHCNNGIFGFVVMLDQRTQDLVRRIEALRKQIVGQTIEIGSSELRISLRMGIALYPDNGTDAETLQKNAAAALRDAKTNGRKYLFYAPEMNAEAGEKLVLETRLRKALENEEFVLHFQPKFELGTGKLRGLEALIRWQDPTAGLVPPAKFIPVLEETGMISDVGIWILRDALVRYRDWRSLGIDPGRIAVNVSQLQLREKDFVAIVRSILNDSGVSGSALELEITESHAMENVDENIRKLAEIRELEVTVAVDDFGTGYSSLSYLARLPVSSLKIDRSFVVNMTEDPEARNIVQTIIALARSLDLVVVAEGVETEMQARLLHQLRCNEVQGYYFGKPMPFAQAMEFLRAPGIDAKFGN